METAAALIARGIDPQRHLTCTDPVAVVVVARGAELAHKRRQDELSQLADRISAQTSSGLARLLGRLFPRKK